MRNGTLRSGSILWVDDEPLAIEPVVWRLRDEGYEVELARAPEEALELLDREDKLFSVAIIDIVMPLSASFSPSDALGGFRAGVALARQVRSAHPNLPLIGCSVVSEPDAEDWFLRFGSGYTTKLELLEAPHRFVSLVRRAVDAELARPKCFIIHGHDETALLSLKNFLQNRLGFDEPIVLREQPSRGRTIIEKFEDYASDIDIAFALLTPDDRMADSSSSNAEKRRARQNVVLELGYFLGKFQRRQGRVLLLHSGPLEIPSDLSGIVYIDISDGIDAAGEGIRSELTGWI